MLTPRFIAVLGALAALSSCTNDDNAALVPNHTRVVLSVAEHLSRARIDDVGNFSFSTGDKFAIYSQGLANDMDWIEATVSESGITYDGEYIYDSTNPAHFRAIYPADAAADANTALWTVAYDQSNYDGYTGSHMLWSKATGSADNANVSLTFHHAMSMVKVTINEVTDIESVTLRSVQPTATIDYVSEIVTASGDACDIIMLANAGTYSAMVPPQILSAEGFSIEVVIGGTTYTFTPESDITLASGHICHITLTPSSGDTEFPSNSLIPEITAETPTKSLKIGYAGDPLYPQDDKNWTKDRWIYTDKYSPNVIILDGENGFSGTFIKKQDNHGYVCPCLGFWSSSNLNLTKTYTLSFLASSTTEGKIGVAVYGLDGSSIFCYHACSIENDKSLDSKEDYMEHSTYDQFKQIKVTIDPSEGSSQYTVYEVEVSPGKYEMKYRKNTSITDCVLVFYNAYNQQVTYTIKNITLVPNE